MTTQAHVWAEGIAIYRQLADLVLRQIIEGVYAEGDLLPSVRQLAAEFQINPLTVVKALQEPSVAALTEKRRGIGLAVKHGARELVLEIEKRKFIEEEWPPIEKKIRALGINVRELLQ